MFIIGWVLSGILAYGIIFSYFQNEYPPKLDDYYYLHMLIGIFVGLSGYIGLFVAFFCTQFMKYGLKFL